MSVFKRCYSFRRENTDPAPGLGRWGEGFRIIFILQINTGSEVPDKVGSMGEHGYLWVRARTRLLGQDILSLISLEVEVVNHLYNDNLLGSLSNRLIDNSCIKRRYLCRWYRTDSVPGLHRPLCKRVLEVPWVPFGTSCRRELVEWAFWWHVQKSWLRGLWWNSSQFCGGRGALCRSATCWNQNVSSQ